MSSAEAFHILWVDRGVCRGTGRREAILCVDWNVLLFSCNPIGQLCLSDPGYSSRTVTW